MVFGFEKTPARAKKSESREAGTGIVSLKNRIKEDLGHVHAFAETLGTETLSEFQEEMRTLHDTDRAAFLERLKKSEQAAEERSRPVLDDLAKARPKEVAERLQWTLIMRGENDEAARLATLEKALSPLLAVRSLRILDHYTNAFTIIFAALPKLQKTTYADLLKANALYGALTSQAHGTISAAVSGLPSTLRELVERGVKNELGLAGKLITATKAEAEHIGMPVKSVASGESAMAELSRWVDTRNRIGKVVDPAYVLTTLENPEPESSPSEN